MRSFGQEHWVHLPQEQRRQLNKPFPYEGQLDAPSSAGSNTASFKVQEAGQVLSCRMFPNFALD